MNKFKKILLLFMVSVLFNGILLAENATYKNITKLYVATFDRAPDKKGLDYWVYDSGLTAEQIAQSFFEQEETKALYPEGYSTIDFIYDIYMNLFKKQPTSDALDYWKNDLDSGIIKKSHFILAIINGAQGNDILILENKTLVGLKFVEAGLNIPDIAKFVMKDVTADASTVTEAYGRISAQNGGTSSGEQNDNSGKGSVEEGNNNQGSNFGKDSFGEQDNNQNENSGNTNTQTSPTIKSIGLNSTIHNDITSSNGEKEYNFTLNKTEYLYIGAGAWEDNIKTSVKLYNSNGQEINIPSSNIGYNHGTYQVSTKLNSGSYRIKIFSGSNTKIHTDVFTREDYQLNTYRYGKTSMQHGAKMYSFSLNKTENILIKARTISENTKISISLYYKNFEKIDIVSRDIKYSSKNIDNKNYMVYEIYANLGQGNYNIGIQTLKNIEIVSELTILDSSSANNNQNVDSGDSNSNNNNQDVDSGSNSTDNSNFGGKQ